MSRLCLRLSAEPESLEPLLQFVEEHALRAGLDKGRLQRIELVIEEAAVNVMHHAYGGEPGNLEVCCTSTAKGLQISLADEGIPFNPLEAPDVEFSADIASREIGGLGVHFIRNFADELQYRRDGKRNLLGLHFLRQTPEGS